MLTTPHHKKVFCYEIVTDKNGRGMWRVRGRGEACTRYWWGNLRERDNWRDPGADGRIILRCLFSKWDVEVWAGLSWLRIGTGGAYL